jgi:hypothetical protein
LSDDQTQFLGLGLLVGKGRGILLECTETLFAVANAWFEFLLGQQSILVSVNQPRDRAFGFLDLTCELVGSSLGLFIVTLKTAFVFIGYTLGIAEQRTHIFPNSFLQ